VISDDALHFSQFEAARRANAVSARLAHLSADHVVILDLQYGEIEMRSKARDPVTRAGVSMALAVCTESALCGYSRAQQRNERRHGRTLEKSIEAWLKELLAAGGNGKDAAKEAVETIIAEASERLAEARSAYASTRGGTHGLGPGARGHLRDASAVRVCHGRAFDPSVEGVPPRRTGTG
jgi:hypothetical protein